MFGGDVVERAEEWRLAVTDDRGIRAMTHGLPEGRAGAHLTRDAALDIAISSNRASGATSVRSMIRAATA